MRACAFATKLFGTRAKALTTLALAWVLWHGATFISRKLIFDAVFSGGPSACKEGAGVCWPFLLQKMRFIIFGIYPFDEQWRILVALLCFFALGAVSMLPRFWCKKLFAAWTILVGVEIVLIKGGFFGLTSVSTAQLSGLPLSILLSVVGFSLALPLGIGLALASCSPLPVVRYIAVCFVEFIRGVPLVAILFLASVMSPILTPGVLEVDRLLVLQITLTVFIAAYVAETVRGGLRAVSPGQIDAAKSLGLGYWKSMRFVILPQALSSVVSPLIVLFIAFFQDTTLVAIVGLMDFLSTLRAAMHDPRWQGIAPIEGYALAAAIYLLFSWGLGVYARFLETIFQPAQPSLGLRLEQPG